MSMKWDVLFQEEFEAEYRSFERELQNELVAHALLLRVFGPNLGRPSVDSLNGSRHANMKELRFGWKGEVWRIAFAFDPRRRAILLVGGDKRGTDQKRFYHRLIAVADERFDRHLREMAAETKHRSGKASGKGIRHGKKP
jgi:hypothetical protein